MNFDYHPPDRTADTTSLITQEATVASHTEPLRPPCLPRTIKTHQLPPRTTTSCAELFYLSHLRSCAASAHGKCCSSSGPAGQASPSGSADPITRSLMLCIDVVLCVLRLICVILKVLLVLARISMRVGCLAPRRLLKALYRGCFICAVCHNCLSHGPSKLHFKLALSMLVPRACWIRLHSVLFQLDIRPHSLHCMVALRARRCSVIRLTTTSKQAMRHSLHCLDRPMLYL